VLLRIVARALAPRHRGGERERERGSAHGCLFERKKEKEVTACSIGCYLREASPSVLSLKYVEASIRAGDGRTRSTLFLL